MAEWLRPVFTRTRTPVQGHLPTFDLNSVDESYHHDHEDRESVQNMTGTTRMRPSSRVSSYIGFRPGTPPPTNHDVFQKSTASGSFEKGTGSFENAARDPEALYHKPSGDQMAETLKVIMMTRNNFSPVPVEYNSCILHVLEAYQDLREQVNAKQEIIDELKSSHTKDIKEFEQLATRWEKKEQDYKGEIKKLEVLLSKTEGGMESVVMARSNSRVHGSKRASDEIGKGISTIKERHAERSSMGEQLPDQHEEFTTEHPMPLPKIDTSVSNWTYQPPSTSETSVDAMSSTDDGTSISQPPPPERPRRRAKAKTEPARMEAPAPQQLSFSFQPGDDSNILGRNEDSYSKNQMLDDLRHRRFTDPERSETPNTNTLTTSPIVTLRPESARQISDQPGRQEREPMSRGTSTNSVVTAIRDNSGRSSVQGNRSGRPGNERGGSTEAVTAAARAFGNAGGSRIDRRSPVGGDGASDVEMLVRNLAERKKVKEKGKDTGAESVNRG